MAFILEEEDAMFTGDNVLGHGTAVFEDLRTYMNSLERMQELFSRRAYPGHGAVLDDGKKRIAEYIAHRQQREQEVLHVLEQARETHEEIDDVTQGANRDRGARSPMEIVEIVYKDVSENLHEPAAGGVVQVLQKLATEGKVVQSVDGHRWRIAERSSAMI
ncbi:MAG: hypothetical protein LQ338_004045 [Usnochroma carphineum]|nr:MAG: hypothetical protein LQ338_004045 [Usnochroma carphineum]